MSHPVKEPRPERESPAPRATTGSAPGLRIALLAVLAFGVFVGWAVGYVPANMDTFNEMHRIGCSYPNAHHNTFAEACDSYRIDIGPVSYHRSYYYVGALSSVMYRPLWSVWRSPVSYYLFGLLFLLAFSLALARACGLQRKYALIPLCYFPVAFSTLHDTGPVKLALLSFPLVALLFARMLDEPSALRKTALAVACAVLIVACVEDKPFYVFLIPSVGLFVMATLMRGRPASTLARDLLKNRLPVLVLAAVCGAGLGALLFVGTTDGQSYFDYLRDAPATRTHDRRVVARSLVEFTLGFPKFGHRVFQLSAPRIADVAAALLATALFCWAAYTAWRGRVLPRASLLLLGASYVALAVVFLIMRTPWAGHHHVFLHVPLLMLLLLVAGSSARRFRLVLASVVVLNLGSVAALTSRPIFNHSARERAVLFRYLSQPEVARANVIHFSTWGGFYQQSLFGDDDQIVTYSRFDRRPEDALRLRDLGARTSRSILNACLDCDLASMRAAYGTPDVREVELGLRRWRLFHVAP